MIFLWKLDHIKSPSLRKRGWETLVYRIADPCGGQARVVAPDELSDHAVAAAVASLSSDCTLAVCDARGGLSGVVRCCHRRGSGRFPRCASESRAQPEPPPPSSRRRARLTKKRHSLPLPSRAHQPPACVWRSTTLPYRRPSHGHYWRTHTHTHIYTHATERSRSLARSGIPLDTLRARYRTPRDSPPPRAVPCRRRDSARIHAAPLARCRWTGDWVTHPAVCLRALGRSRPPIHGIPSLPLPSLDAS